MLLARAAPDGVSSLQRDVLVGEDGTKPKSSSCSQSNRLSKGGNRLVLNPHGFFSFSDGSQIALATDILPRGLRIRKPWDWMGPQGPKEPLSGGAEPLSQALLGSAG